MFPYRSFIFLIPFVLLCFDCDVPIDQFFKLPWAGSLQTALLGACAAIILWKTFKKVGSPIAVLPLCFLPVFFQEGALGDSLYYYQGFVAFIMVAIFLWLYVAVFQEKNKLGRVIAGVLMSVLLYWLVGSAAVLFAVCVILLDALSGKDQWYLGVASLAAVLLFAWGAVRLGFIQSMRLALLQDFYYEPLVHPGLYIHASWIALPLVTVLAVLVGKLKGNVAQVVVACASILHLPEEKLGDVMHRIGTALKEGGILYTSFKYGDFAGERNGRYFRDFTEESFREFLKDFYEFRMTDQWITSDVRPNRGEERWLNVLLRRTM